MRVFLRANVPLFISWGLEMLTTQLYDVDSEVAEEAIDILDEACEEEVSFLSPLHVPPVLFSLNRHVQMRAVRNSFVTTYSTKLCMRVFCEQAVINSLCVQLGLHVLMN